MQLQPTKHGWYDLEIITHPPVGDWEASFDQGQTWLPGSPYNGGWRWMVAGPAAPRNGALPLKGTTEPMLRPVSNPDLVVRDAPRIVVE